MTTTAKRKKASSAQKKQMLDAERKALVESLYGSMSWMKYGVNEYLKEKQAEIDAENAV